jgi:predicted RNase H-like nuclease (RuvC/YqgF family)
MSERKYNISNKTFKGLKFRLHHRDKQLLQNLKGLLENHYIDDLEIDQVEYDVWADLFLIDKNSPKRVNELADEIRDYKSEIATLINERQKLKRKHNKEIRTFENKIKEQQEEIKKLQRIELNNRDDYKTYLKNIGLSIERLAQKSSLSVSTVYKFANGRKIKHKNKQKILNAIQRFEQGS